ncbi:hypothetical protein MSAN_01187700 [Mycena sanguinolenta]|uniref:Uncharacterized protein n=1 Tax=Mycena sanguinolenta TaxID=230812 RepID=A0A8H7D7C6_9AGAR|nr:hypothetical protein MSAN_01187700 [Mycena sanguinolenta]
MPESIISLGLTKTMAELLFYGVYLTLFAAVVYLFRSGNHRPPPLLLQFGIGVQFLAITAHLITAVVQAYSCLAKPNTILAVELCFLDLDAPVVVASTALFVLTSLVTDILVIQRLSVTWTHRLTVLIFPVFCLLVQAAGGVGVVITFSSATLFSLSNGWVTTTLVASLLISLYSSGMIYWKISRTARQFNVLEEGSISAASRLVTTLAIMIESAGIQTSATFALLLAFESGVGGAALMQAIGPVMFGLSTVLIHARVGLGWAKQAHGSTSTAGERYSFSAGQRTESIPMSP